MTLLTLNRGVYANVQIRPRWPAQQVQVDSDAFSKLQRIQMKLPEHIVLILTRGYEKKESQLGFARNKFRALGINAFRCFYSSRQGEIAAIFGSNGHDVDGTHLDVSFLLHGRRVRLLPLSVFTPLFWQKRRVERYALPLYQVKEALIKEGFRIHLNPTESLQIHCDLVV
ncbi:hypothetical protein EV682_11745 [Iodobacter fluviatilis]|uniref:Uncharacterized protein n=2 Tax=Iodobacter fluviatilis TaxID=537 RepID=A0A377SS26_9NEIS|nr:hypothetical protein EV682_11745 [Iodobacter fluviatilis]STR44842.1 Uncharacterised protein [Iodobacter fluviatilis]